MCMRKLLVQTQLLNFMCPQNNITPKHLKVTLQNQKNKKVTFLLRSIKVG